jgi:hypothetical protein
MTMEYMVLLYLDESAFEGMTEEDHQRLRETCAAEDEELERAGKLVIARALEQPQKAVTLSVRGSKLSRTDGPFAETKEHLGGLVLIRADSMDEACRIAGSSPLVRYGKIEVRPCYDVRDVV